MPISDDIETIEISLLLEGIYRAYGYDFREYAPASLRRRILKAVQAEKLKTIPALLDKLLHHPASLTRILNIISVDTSAMFRDPGFYGVFRDKVVPLLKDKPYFRVWHVGCAGGEEVYSMAILLGEEGLYDKARLYATDMNATLIEKAKAGVFPIQRMQEYTENYIKAGGQKEFSSYYTARYGNALFQPALRKNIVWAAHNLVTDASFNEFQIILCRNVMIYFNRFLQNQVHALIYESLAKGGVLCLGDKESLKFSPHERDYAALDENERIYAKV